MNMTDYSHLLDKLREQRARPAWRPEEDRVLLEEADAIFETLSEADQEAARLQSPRAFPDSSLVENVDREAPHSTSGAVCQAPISRTAKRTASSLARSRCLLCGQSFATIPVPATSSVIPVPVAPLRCLPRSPRVGEQSAQRWTRSPTQQHRSGWIEDTRHFSPA